MGTKPEDGGKRRVIRIKSLRKNGAAASGAGRGRAEVGDDGRDREEKGDSIRRRAVGTARRKVGRRRKGKKILSVSRSRRSLFVA